MTNSEQKMPAGTPLKPQKRALLVGASSGIGAALAQKLADEGYLVALLARRGELLEKLTNEINSKHGATRARYYVHDVTDYESIPALLRQIMSDLGGLDTFIYNTGVSHMVGLKKYDFAKDRATTEVNFIGALAWLNPVAEMFQSLQAGQIVGVSSVAGERGRVGNPSYNASKAALTTYLEALRNRLTRYGVNVLTVKPGPVETDMIKDATGVLFPIPAEQAASDIYKAMRKRKQEVYTSGRWRWIMLVVRNIIMYSVVSSVLIVAAFGIYNVISTVVMEKHRDIAILKSMGFLARDIQRIFVIQGFILGITGSLLGLPLGSALMYAIMQIEFKPPGSTEPIVMPLDWGWMQFAIATGFALSAALIAAFLPARKGARVQPVDILRGGI